MDNKLKIMNYLGKHVNRVFTMHELSKLLSIPYATFYRTIQDMQDLLVTKTIGKSKTLHMNPSNPIISSYLVISSDEEKKEYFKNKQIIKKIAEEIATKDIVILFGSYAKRKETEKSDIDLLIINNDGAKSLFFSKQELLFKRKINPVFITKSEFKKMLQDREENIGKQALKDHVILNNPEGFWRCVLDVI